MKKRTLIWIGIASIAFVTADTSFGVTIPAGTPLVVRTLHGISSIDAPGTRFPAEVAKDVVVNGKVGLPVGTKVSGQVATSNALTPVHKDSVSTSLMYKWVGALWQSKPPVPLDWRTPRAKHDAAFRSQPTRIRFHRAKG